MYNYSVDCGYCPVARRPSQLIRSHTCTRIYNVRVLPARIPLIQNIHITISAKPSFNAVVTVGAVDEDQGYTVKPGNYGHPGDWRKLP